MLVSRLALVAVLVGMTACNDATKTPGDDTGGNVTPSDRDGDSHVADEDCDDVDPSIYVGAPELCDGKDNDCDGVADDEPTDAGTWYADADADGFGTGDGVTACDAPEGTVAQAGDCDDANAAINPDAPEQCNEIDDDCDGTADDGVDDGNVYYADADGDGYGSGTGFSACEAPAGAVLVAGDCDDAVASVNPGATEVCNDVDDDCDGAADDGADDGNVYYVDRDRDGFGAGSALRTCDPPPGAVTNGDDCDDAIRAINPDATEVCNDVDDNCDGTVDTDAVDRSSWYPDVDRDTYGDADATATLSCDAPAGYVATATDCDDGAVAVNPAATEVCNDIDDDCDGTVDESDATDAYTLYRDADRDGYGAGTATRSCDPLSGYTTTSSDCDDTVAAVNPAAIEVCNGYDDDCDGRTDGSDATDSITVWPDSDGDGYGSGRSSVVCETSAGFATNGDDCDDTERAVYPGADEYCDGIDDDCDGAVDEDDVVDASYFFLDVDGDGFGDPAEYDLRCEGVTNGLDCNDADATEPQVADIDSTSTSPTGTLRAPWWAIQDAIDAADECVLVYDGTYYESLDFGGKDIAVSSVDGMGATIIDGAGAGPVVSFDSGETSGAELRGFTLTGGSGFEETTTSSYSCGSSSTCYEYHISYCGGGLYIDGATPTLEGLRVVANDVSVPADSNDGTNFYYYYSFGGGMCVRNAVLTVSEVDLYSNYADEGGGAYVESTASLTYTHGLVVGNRAANGAGFEADGGTLTVKNAILAYNVASVSGGGVYGIDADLDVVNATLGECEAATSGGGVYASGTSSLTLLNSIIWGADAGAGVLADATASFTGTYSDVFGNAGGNYSGVVDPTGTLGNLSADPAFMSATDDGDYTNDDWSLSSTSVCVDAGSAAGIYRDVNGTRNDMGAFGGPGGAW